MSLIKCTYLGDLNCDAVHLHSGKKIRTDAPLDHYGKGESFSPTDLLATSLGTCLLTIMAITARSNGWEPENIYLNIEKIMTKNKERGLKFKRVLVAHSERPCNGYGVVCCEGYSGERLMCKHSTSTSTPHPQCSITLN